MQFTVFLKRENNLNTIPFSDKIELRNKEDFTVRFQPQVLDAYLLWCSVERTACENEILGESFHKSACCQLAPLNLYNTLKKVIFV